MSAASGGSDKLQGQRHPAHGATRWGSLPATDAPDHPIQIFRIINRLNVGGPAVHVTLLTAGLNDGQMGSTLITGCPEASEGDMAYYTEQRGAPVIIVPEMSRTRSLLSPVKDWVALYKLYRLLRRHRPQIVHTHTAIGGFLGRVAAILAGVPVRVHTFHGHVFEGYYPRALALLFIYLERLLARFTQGIVVLSESQAQDLAYKYRIAPREKITVIPLGLDLEPFLACQARRGQFRRELGLGDGARLVGVVGRMVPIKNHRLFLDAAARVASQQPAARFVVVGDGVLRPKLEGYARELGIADRVIFTGWRRDQPCVYADLDVLVNSSDNEGTPLSTIEAMASGLPVVATHVGGLPDLIADGETGYLVPPGDPDQLAGAILRLLQDPDDALRVGKAARAVVQERFSLRRLLSDMEQLYGRLLAQKGILVSGAEALHRKR